MANVEGGNAVFAAGGCTCAVGGLEKGHIGVIGGSLIVDSHLFFLHFVQVGE